MIILFFFLILDGLVPGSYEVARLRFAHAETVLPFSCLIGLFLDAHGEDFIVYHSIPVFSSLQSFSLTCGLILTFILFLLTDFDKILREEPLQLPPKPPQKRIWHGSTVAPFAGNNMLVLYSCPANNTSKYFVQVLHNELPTRMSVSVLWFVFSPLLNFYLCTENVIEFENFYSRNRLETDIS